MAKDTVFRKKATLNAGGRLLDLSTPLVMGIINLTPDSFFAGSRKPAVADALQQAGQMLTDGAMILDLGAYSSRPGAADITEQEETDRLLPVVEAISKTYPQAILSVDTFRSGVAEAAVRAGAHIINDISGGQLDPQMLATIGRLQVPYILMHMKGTPQNMVHQAHYQDVFTEVLDYFADRYAQLTQLGVHDVILDPGFGFAKTAEHSYQLLSRLSDFDMLQLPVLVGVSRKRMIYGQLGIMADEALNGTTVLNTLALSKGASILRVHDVKPAVEAVKLWMCMENARNI
jgi:dihydropteroate synthase